MLLNYLDAILILIQVLLFNYQLKFFVKIRVWIKPEPDPKSVGSGSGLVFQIQTGLDRVRVW